MVNAIDAVYMVEASPALRETQKNLLCGESAVLEEHEIGHKCISKYSGIPIVWTDNIRFIPLLLLLFAFEPLLKSFILIVLIPS